MTDRKTEIYFEETATLLTNEGYFARYRHYIPTMLCWEAWEKVESELPFGLRRFSSYDSFKNALRDEVLGVLPSTVRFSFDPEIMRQQQTGIGFYVREFPQKEATVKCPKCGNDYCQKFPVGTVTIHCKCGHEFDVYTK